MVGGGRHVAAWRADAQVRSRVGRLAVLEELVDLSLAARSSAITCFSSARKRRSTPAANSSGIERPQRSTMMWSVSNHGRPRRWATSSAIVDLPAPMKPMKARWRLGSGGTGASVP